MGSVIGFWSYARRDDEAERGRIALLSRHIAEQYGMHTGESVDIWLDLDRLRWGDRWRESIQDALSRVRFFIPVITPRYFQRLACRQELIFFTSAARYRGAIMPVLYADLPTDHPDFPDPARQLVDRYQLSDWRELRDQDPDSAGYRAQVRKMARVLAEAGQEDRPADPAGDPDELVKSVIVGVTDLASAITEIGGLLASPGAHGLPGRLDAESRRLLGVAHTLSGDVHALDAALPPSGARPGWSVTKAGMVLHEALDGGARLAATLSGMRPDDRVLRAALERTRLALLLADDCKAPAERWAGGRR